ncbi:MAG TPA: hypothetical protein VGV35_17385, partial [Bryobacteraceae bacterium]|nr:hypothetical protein [Bryobacteraceae bacterium]
IYSNSRLTDIKDLIRAESSRMEATLRADIGRLDQRMDHLEQRMDHFEQRMDRFEARMDRLEARMDRFERERILRP